MGGFTGEFYKTLREGITSILFRLFQKIQELGRLQNAVYDASIVLIPKPDKENKERKLQANISDELRC